MFKILSFLVLLFLRYCTGEENTNGVRNVSIQSAAEAALHKALGELRSKADVNAVLEPASIPISEGPSHYHVTTQSNIDDVPSTTISMLEMDAVQPGQIQTAAKFDFVPHFEDTTFEFMMSEGVNKVDNVAAIVSFYGLLDGSVPEFSIKFDRLNYFAIGEISMQQESNYLLCFVPIVLRGGVTVALADANNGIYKFKIQATQGEHQSESTVKVEIAKFQPAPINNSSVDSVELLASSVSSADLAELAKAPPSSEDGVTEGADLVLGSGSLATDFPSENAAIPSEEESNSNMDTMVDPEFPAGDGAEIPDDTAMMSDPLSDETTATVGVPLSIKNNTVNNDNQVALLKESMTKGVTNNSEMGGERKESENMSMSHPDSVNTFDVETTEEPQEELPVEDAENTKADEGNSGIQEENMPVLSPSSNNTLEVDTKIQPHEGTMLGENGEANSENNEMSDNSMSGNDMMEGNNGDTNDDMMPKEESQQETSGNVEQELENGATTIETGETAAPPAVDKIDQGTNENNIDRNQENTVDFKRTNLNDIVQIQVTGLQKDSTIRLSGNLPAEKILPNLEVKVTVNDTQAIDEVIQLWIEPNTILDIKPHFVMPGDTVKFVTVHTNFTVDSNERGEIISLKARFANHKVHERLGAFAETKLFVKSDAKARLSEKMKFDKVMYEFGISEWAKTGTKIGLIQIDAQSKPMVIKYSVFGRDSQKFTIDNDGILYVNCNGASTCLDRETTPMYQFAVIATDSENGQSSPPALVSIVVDDENDNGPLLKLYDNEVVITSGEILTPFLISTIDYDTEVNENNELELGGEAATFLVVEKLSTGLWQLRVKSYTEPGEYQLNISAIDMSGKNPSDNTIVKVIVIEPESPIRFRRNVYERAISSEKVVKGVPIAQLDLEGISVDAVTFVILENPGWLAIESFGGNIFVGDVPRKGIESGQYIATVAAVDRESQKILAKCQVNIAVENFHEPYRTFLRPFYSVVISPENVTDPYVVELFDRSLSGNVHIVINENKAWAQDDRLVDMNDNSTIWIMENQLLINVEKLGDIRLVYLVLSNGEHNATVSILVRSDPEKELMEIYATSKPRFIDPWISEKIPIKLQILEELPSGYTLVHIPAYNPMDMKAISNFSLAGKDAHYFRVDSSTGNIYLQKSIDFEAVSESSTSPVILEFQLHAFNQIECNNRLMCQMTESVANFHVEVLNIDDATPTLDIIGSNIVEIPENSPIGTLVAQLSCQDRDSQRLNLQLSGKESENFHLRQKDNRYLLEVSSPSSLDRERIDRMSLIVTCTDPAGNFVQLPIVIRVLDENDNRPLFISPTSTKDIKVYNNWPAGVALLRFQAVDKDLGSNARIIYTIKDDNKIAKYLSVDAATGILSTNVSLSSADTSQPYTITVLASDDHVTPKFTSTTTVLVRVLEAASSSENALRIIQPAIDYVLEIPEDVPMGRKIFDVVAISGSENENNLADGMLKYYLEPIDVSDRGWLRINEETGEVFTAAQFDFEQQEFVTMKIVVKNGMTNSNGTGLLRVKLLNMDDNESRFLEKSQGNTVIISEGTDLEEERSIGNISAFDEDGDRIFYHTLPHCSKHDGRYRIDKRSGEIFVTPIGIKNAAPSQLCILASPSSDFDPSLKQEYNSSADNQLGIKIYQAERRNVFEQLLKLVKEFGNNSVINLAPNSESTILSSSNFANRPPNFFSFKLKELEFVPYSQKSIDSKKILIATPIDLIDVDSSSGDLRIDPKIYSMDEGIYIVKIDVNFKKVSYDTLLTKQIHVLSSENRLKFVFDEPVNSMALNLQLFKNKTEETISSVNPGIQLIIMQPQIYSSRSNRSSVCFHLANASMPSFSTILPVNDTIHMVSTASNFNPFLDSTYKSFKVVNIEPCLASTNDESIITDSFNTYSSSFSNIKLSRELLLLICLVASSILILTALCGYTCFVARYRVYLERQSTKGPSTESSYSNGKTRPANSPFAVPQFIDARKITSSLDY